MHPTAQRFQQRLAADGLHIEVVTHETSARTAAEAAETVGCEVGQILKSLVFLRDGEPVMVLCAGDRRVDSQRLGLTPAKADQARNATGYSIGGIPPLGHPTQLPTLIDDSLHRFGTLWAAAGTPHDVFEIATDALIAAIHGAEVTAVAQAA
jgi:prolyl-tRNA editing enzyme YbaK/EbsC (Cys-tRNA(Pro) deacylase)